MVDREGDLQGTSVGDLRVAKGAGSLCATVEDLLKWQIELHGQRDLLSEESYQ